MIGGAVSIILSSYRPILPVPVALHQNIGRDAVAFDVSKPTNAVVTTVCGAFAHLVIVIVHTDVTARQA